jgi:hypothetical protein
MAIGALAILIVVAFVPAVPRPTRLATHLELRTFLPALETSSGGFLVVFGAHSHALFWRTKTGSVGLLEMLLALLIISVFLITEHSILVWAFPLRDDWLSVRMGIFTRRRSFNVI